MSPEHAQLIERGWAALPADYRMPDKAPTLEEARAWCRHLAETHYENFHVASWFLPKRLLPHFHSVYAYCRVSDDLGDETGDRDTSLALLDLWGQELDACYRGEARHAVFVARKRPNPDPSITEGSTAPNSKQLLFRAAPTIRLTQEGSAV
jgi:hypothetical protein